MGLAEIKQKESKMKMSAGKFYWSHLNLPWHKKPLYFLKMLTLKHSHENLGAPIFFILTNAPTNRSSIYLNSHPVHLFYRLFIYNFNLMNSTTRPEIKFYQGMANSQYFYSSTLNKKGSIFYNLYIFIWKYLSPDEIN